MVSLYRWHQFWRVINKLLQPLPSGRPPAAEGVLRLSAREASHINTQESSYFNGKLRGANCTSDLRLIWYRFQVQNSAPETGYSDALHVFTQSPHASAGIIIIIIIIIILACYSLGLFRSVSLYFKDGLGLSIFVLSPHTIAPRWHSG